MMPLHDLLVFVLASAALSVAPGPDNLFVLSLSALHGRRAGILLTLGLCSGLLVHIAAVALGVAALFQSSVLAFTVLKLVGAAYLLYLAWQAFRAGEQQSAAGLEAPAGARALYLRGILMNVTNPKVAIFFLAFLPQFADPARGSVPAQIVALGLIFLVTALVIFCGFAWMAGRIGAWLMRSAHAQRIMNRLTAALFVVLACRLALSRQ